MTRNMTRRGFLLVNIFFSDIQPNFERRGDFGPNAITRYSKEEGILRPTRPSMGLCPPHHSKREKGICAQRASYHYWQDLTTKPTTPEAA
jgi:hypothetical protein